MLGSDAAITANGPSMAHDARISQRARDVGGAISPLTRAFAVERVTRIELAWPAWKAGALPLSYTRVSAMILGAKPSDLITESGRQDSNLRSSAPKADALATTLRPGRPACPNVRDECRARRSEDQSSCSCICGLVRRDPAPNSRFEVHSRPCAEKRVTAAANARLSQEIEVTVRPGIGRMEVWPP
jgi:hypothetical protein